jgi:hypothetical protein
MTIYLVSRRTRRTEQGQPRHTIGLLRSTDGGRSFRPRSELRPSNLAQNPTGLVVLSDGTLVVSFYDFQRNVDGFGERGILARPRAWAVRSTDGGAAFSEPMFVSEDCGAGNGFPGYPFLAVDASGGRFADRLYHLCVRPGFDGLSLSTSDDVGETWTDPLRVDVAAGEGADVRTPMIAVDGEGRAAVAWYARRQIEGRTCQETFVAVSVDGGASFLEPLRVADEPSCPGTPGNGRVAQSWAMGGDYNSLAAGPDGRFHLLWADSRSGVFQIHHAVLTIESNGTEEASLQGAGWAGRDPAPLRASK